MHLLLNIANEKLTFLLSKVIFLIVNFAVDVAGDIIDPRLKRGRV